MQAPGTTLQERYRILRVIDENPATATFEALDTRFGTTVVVKELAADAPEPVASCFEREARVLNALAHPALPFVFDIFSQDGAEFLVCRHIASEPIERVIAAKGGTVSLGEAVDTVDRVLDALELLQARKPPLVHGNVTSTSVRVTPRDNVLLTDFRWIVEAGHPAPGFTAPFAAPEQMRGDAVDARTDVYAAGVLLYLLLTGKQPADAAERLDAGPATLIPVDLLTPGIPGELSYAVHIALALDPEDRPASAAELRALIGAARGQLQTDRVVNENPTAVFDKSADPTDRIGAAAESPRTTVICRTCGVANEPTRTFCPFCGSLLRADARAYAAMGLEHLVTVPETPQPGARPAEPVLPPEAGRVRLLVVEGEQPGTIYPLRIPETVIGRGDGDLQFPDDPFMSGRHARVIYRGGRFFVQDNNSRNGTFLRVRGEEPVRNGDMFLVGSQLLRVECGARPEQGHLRVIFHDGATGERFPLRGQRTVIGRHEGDITFPADASLAEAHAYVECRDDGLVLVDGGSRNGSFLRVQTEAEVHDGDLVIVGQHIFRFENDVEVGLG